MSKNISILFYTLLASVCAYFLISFLFLTFSSYWPGPIHDYWFEIPKIQDFFDGHLTLRELVTAHANAHRLVIPRLIFIADYQWFHGSNLLIVLISIACKLAMLILLNTVIKKETLAIRALLNTLIVCTLFNSINIPNILNSSNVQWDLMALFSSLSVYCYAKAHLHVLKKNTKIFYFSMAYLYFVLAFFSQGGSFPVIFVFLFIAILNRNLFSIAASILFIIFVVYLTAVVLPVNDEDNPGFMSAVAMFLFKPKYVALFAIKLMSANLYNFNENAFYFSAWSGFLVLLGIALQRKTKKIANNALLYIAIFCLVMMIFIAAFRVDFAPNAWISNRYHPNVLLFILAIHLHIFLTAGLFFKNIMLALTRTVIFSVCLINLLVPQYFQRGTPGDFANMFFETQTSALFYGPNQESGRRLVTSLQDFDKIAEADPFFQKYGLAYYANKQGGDGFYKESKKPNQRLIANKDMGAFEKSCSENSALINYSPVENSPHFHFSTALDMWHNSLFKALFSRNTFYAVDENGLVAGFAYLYVNPEDYFNSARIEGLLLSPSVKYIADIKNGHAHCLYQLKGIN